MIIVLNVNANDYHYQNVAVSVINYILYLDLNFIVVSMNKG